MIPAETFEISRPEFTSVHASYRCSRSAKLYLDRSRSHPSIRATVSVPSSVLATPAPFSQLVPDYPHHLPDSSGNRGGADKTSRTHSASDTHVTAQLSIDVCLWPTMPGDPHPHFSNCVVIPMPPGEKRYTMTPELR